MAEKKAPVNRKFVDAGTGKKVSVAGTGSAVGLRVGAVVLWLAAIAFEVLTILVMNGSMYVEPAQLMYWLIGAIVLDLICVVIGSFLWKAANHRDPPSEKNKLLFTIQTQAGVIAAILAFLPLIVLLLTNKKLDPKLKKIVGAVAGVALVAAIGLGIDFSPTSAEDVAAEEQASAISADGTVYWTRFGKSYHVDPNCSTLLRSSTVFQGTMTEAFEAGRDDPCDICTVPLQNGTVPLLPAPSAPATTN